MERLVTSVVVLLSLWHLHGVQAARDLGELPPCKDVRGGIPGWDCFDPPTHDLPPCDFRHQRAGIDCWPKSPPKPHDSTLVTAEDAPARVEGALPPCKDVPGGIPPVHCFDPPPTPASKLFASTQGLDSIDAAATQRSVEGRLPPCRDVPGGIPNWDCYDPPATPLPPCDFKHHSPGIDCQPGRTMLAPVAASTQDPGHELPPCKDVPGGTPDWDCYDPPAGPLPPCGVKHVDCNTSSLKPPPPPKAMQGATNIADFL